MKDGLRTEENKRDKNLEAVLNTLNTVLEDDEQELISQYEAPEYPSVFIVGNARCGSTLIYQYLAATGLFSYPSNIISRFYQAPYIGSLIHKAFVNFDKHGEILGNKNITFESVLGKTKSAVAPHEFWYFWRRFFEFGEIQFLNKGELSKVDTESFLQELAALEGAFRKPLLLKGIILNWNLPFLKKLIPGAVFIHLKREELYNMHSIYKARKDYFGDVNKWYSFKPPEYSFLKNENVYVQLAGQVLFTNKRIQKDLEIHQNDVIDITYRKFCNSPQNLLNLLKDKFAQKGYNLNFNYEKINKFDVRNSISEKSFNVTKAKEALSKIKSNFR